MLHRGIPSYNMQIFCECSQLQEVVMRMYKPLFGAYKSYAYLPLLGTNRLCTY